MDAFLTRPVHVGTADKPFGALTREEVSARADELKAVTGWGPMMRVAPVAQAWRELSRRMQQADAATVAELRPEQLADLVDPLWIGPQL